MIPVILSGGFGTRLWPLSRRQYPKQFLPIIAEETLFQATIQRLQAIEGIELPIIVCNEEHRFIVAEQLRQIGCESQGIILEPVGRNTAPAIALAALHLKKQGKDGLMLVLPADHVIGDTVAFGKAIGIAADVAQRKHLVTFGVVPDKAETGYGYIQQGDLLFAVNAYAVAKFVEKPDKDKAALYVSSGEYFWNSGIFAFQRDFFLEELQQYSPDVFHACHQAIQLESLDMGFVRVESDAFASCPAISVDYAVMEKTNRAAVVPFNVKWSDVGAWQSVWEVGEQDVNKNMLRGDVVIKDSSKNLAYSENHLVCLLGVDDLIVINTRDVTLVASKDKVHQINEIVEQLKLQNRVEVTENRKVYRPWGSYDCIDSESNFLVKRIVVNPRAKLSLQKHRFRAEHWVVVKGTATVTRGDKIFKLTENQSTYIPIGLPHRLENTEDIPLELIEIQSGKHLREDDIIRLDDHYGRGNECIN